MDHFPEKSVIYHYIVELSINFENNFESWHVFLFFFHVVLFVLVPLYSTIVFVFPRF